jgi:IclR family mhp operon transcriptional activator
MRSSADRVLLLIKTLNRHGACSVVELQESTSMSRPAIYRLLGVLSRLNYVSRVPGQAKFQLTTAIHELCDRVTDNERLVEVATPLLVELQKEIIWPSSLSIFNNGKMVIRATTKGQSPLVFDRGHIGMRLPILETAQGRAYLAFCPKQERRTVLNLLKWSDDPADQLMKTARIVTKMLNDTEKRGYGVRKGRYPENTSSIAVPVLVAGKAVASVSISFLSSALSLEQAANRFLTKLRRVASEIGGKMC